jgi:antitoxin VapB
MTTRATAKIFKNGNSQAVRLPKSFQFDVDEVEILRRGDEVILRKPRQNLSEALRSAGDPAGGPRLLRRRS